MKPLASGWSELELVGRESRVIGTENWIPAVHLVGSLGERMRSATRSKKIDTLLDLERNRNEREISVRMIRRSR